MEKDHGEFSEKSGPNGRIRVSSMDYVWVIAILPVVSFIFPYFLAKITNFDLDTVTRQSNILYLLLSKRLYLYAIALSTVVLAAKRSMSASPGLGQRVMEINSEVFGGNYTKFEQEGNREIYEALDKVEGTTQAIALPVVIAGSLAISFLLLTMSTAFTNFANEISSSSVMDDAESFLLAQPMKDLLAGLIPLTSFLSNAAVCLLFAKAELQNLLKSIHLDPERADIAGLVLAFFITLPAVLTSPGGPFWPVQNFLNTCIAVTVTRAAQLPRLPSIVLALSGLAVYDVISVVGTQQFTDGGRSIMEAVAMAKLSNTAASPEVSTIASTSISAPFSFVDSIFSSWRPGLFEVVVGGRVSDALGLGDVIFPAILAGWALRFDSYGKSVYNTGIDDKTTNENKAQQKKEQGYMMFPASLAGYAIGCLMCEIFQTGQGQPALLYIVPSMFLSIALTGLLNQNLSEMWQFDAEAFEGRKKS